MINIEEVKRQIVQAIKPLNPEQIILFGSYAYGTPTEDSDLDICVVKKEVESKWEEKAKIRRLLSEIKMPKDILVETKQYFDTHSDENWINTALHDARHYGCLLYEKI